MSEGGPHDSVYFGDMAESVVEQNQVHLHVVLVVVVLLKQPVELLLGFLVVPAVLVELGVDRSLVRWVGSQEIPEKTGVPHNVVELFFEAALHNATHQFLSHDGPVLLVDQPITEHPHTLIPPKPDEGLLCGKLVDSRTGQAFVHSAQVSKVEDVVELDWRSGKKLNDLFVELESAVS